MADLNIDSLQLQIAADTQQAERSLNRLSSSLATLNRSLETVSRHTNDVSKVAYAFTSMQNLQMPNLSSFITQLETMSRIDLKNIENKKINLDIRLTGASEAERMKYAIEDAVNNTKIDTKRISKQLQDAFKLSPDVRNELKEQLDLMTQDFAKGGSAMSQFEKVFQILDKMGQMTRAEFDKAGHGVSDSLSDEYKRFLDYVKNHPISTSLLDTKSGHSGAMSEWNEEIKRKGLAQYFRKEGSTLDTGLFKDLVDQFPTVMAGYRGLVDGEQSVAASALQMKDAIKEALETAKTYLNGAVSPQENTKAAGNAAYGIYDDLIKRVNAEKEKSMRESATKIPMDFDIDENRLVKQVENAVRNVSKKDFGTINLKLGVDTTTMVQDLMKAFKAEQFKGLGTLTTNIKEVADAMHSFDGLDMKGNGLASFIRGLAALSKESKNLDDSVFTRVADGMLELQRASSAAGVAEVFTSFIRSINTFIRSSEKMKDTANAFPALALEMQEFFSAMSHMDISDNTVRMAEALAEISKRGQKAGAAMQELQKKSEETNTTIQKSSKIIDGLCKVGDALVNVLKKLGSAALTGVKNLVHQIGQLGKHSSNVSSLTNNIKTLIGTLIGFRGIQGVFNWTKEMVTMGANVTEIDHIVESVFGENMIGYVNEWANNAIEKFGIAATSAKQYAGTLSAMFQASNISMKNSNQMALDMVELAGDLSAFYNIDTEDSYKKIQSGLTGMVRPLRSLGIDLSVATLKEFALAQGINKSWNEMTQAEKVMLRYQYLMQNTVTQQGDFERTSLSLANSMRTLRAYVSETTTQLGVGFGAAIRHVVVWLNTLMKYILKAAQAFAVFMQTLFGKYKGGASGAALGDTFGLDDASSDADALADGASDAADGLGDAADNAEKLRKELSVLPFDELNQLNKDQEKTSSGSGSGGGAGGGGLGGLGDFGDGFFDWDTSGLDGKLGELESKLSEWAERIKAFAKADNWFEVGGEVARGLNEGLGALYDVLDPTNIDNYVMPWVNRFVDTINGFIHYINFELLGSVLGRGINDLVKIANGFLDPKTGINFEELGTRLGQGFMGMIREIKWRDLGNLISNKFMVAWRIFKGFVEELKPDEIGAAIRDVIKGAVENFDPVTIGASIGSFVTKIATTIKEGFSDVETWANLGKKMGEGINAFLKNFDGKEVAEGISSFLNAIITTVGSMLKTIDVGLLVKDIKDFYVNLDWDTISAFGAPLISTKFLSAIGKALVENLLGMNLISVAISNVISKACDAAGNSQAVTDGANKTALSLGKAMSLEISAIETLVAPVAEGLGVRFIQKLLGEDTRGENLDKFEGDVNSTFINVEDTLVGSGIRMVQASASTVGQVVANFFGMKTSIEEDSSSLDETNTKTTNHWRECYNGVLTHLQTFATGHDTALSQAETKVSEFVSAVQTGLSNTGQSWKTLSVDEEGHKQTLLESLDEQIEKVHTWEENLAILAKAGIDEGFLTELARMGTDGAPLVESAVAQINSEGGIDTLNAKWEELINAQGLMDNVGKTLKDAGITNIETAFGEVTTKVESEGKNIVEGGAKGVKDNISIFTDATKKMGEDGWAALRTYDQSHSPSKLYEGEGKNIIDGLKLGIQRNETQVTGAMSKMAKNMESAFKNNISIAGMINDVFKDLQNICTTVYNYGVDIGQSFADGIKAVYIPAPYIYVSSYDWIDLGDGAGFSVPNFNVDWYAKGGLFTDFAVFGEAGDEAALPLENQKVMKRIASAITETGNLGLDQEILSSAVARGYVQAMMANQGNERPIDVYATLYTENNEVLARAVQRGQQSIDYRNNPTASYGY